MSRYRFTQFNYQLRGAGSGFTVRQLQIIFKPDTGVATPVNSSVDAGLFLRTESADEPVNAGQVAGNKWVQVGRVRLKVERVSSQHKKHTAMRVGDDAALF